MLAPHLDPTFPAVRSLALLDIAHGGDEPVYRYPISQRTLFSGVGLDPHSTPCMHPLQIRAPALWKVSKLPMTDKQIAAIAGSPDDVMRYVVASDAFRYGGMWAAG